MKKRTLITNIRDTIADSVEPDNARTIAIAYWRVVIVCSIAGLIAALFYGYVQYTATLEIFSVHSSSASTGTVFTRDDLDKAVARFDARAQRYASLQTTPLVAPDPAQ